LKIYGYIHVNPQEQDVEGQRAALLDAGVLEADIYLDERPGRASDRTQYKSMLQKLKRDDLLYIKSIGHLGHNYREMLEQWHSITMDKGVDIVVLDMPLLDTRRGKDLMETFLSDIVLQVLSFVAENERTNIRQRQAEGIAAAKARGVAFGRPAKDTPEDFGKIVKAWERKRITTDEALRLCDMSESTFYRRLREHRIVHGGKSTSGKSHTF